MWKLASLALLVSVVVLAQDHEEGRVERNGDQATLIVDSPRPVDAAATTLAREYAIRVNVEDPLYPYKTNLKGGHLEVRYAVLSDGRPRDIPTLIQAIADTANKQWHFSYRVDRDGDWYSIIPTRIRDERGNEVDVTPLLDRRVTIPYGVRRIHETATLMADALSAQTGRRIACCQSFVGGYPWGMESIAFESHNEPARSILRKLFIAGGGQQNRDYWLQRCDPQPHGSCFINWTIVPATN